MNKFEKLVRQMTKEHTLKEGSVNCEFSTNNNKLKQKIKILNKYSNTLLKGYTWEIFKCETCAEYNKHSPYHCMIVWREFWGSK